MTKLRNVAAICGALIVASFVASAHAQQLDAQGMACAQQCQQTGASCFNALTPSEQGNKFAPKAKQCNEAEVTCIRGCSKK